MLSHSDIYRPAAHRFRDRATRSGFKNGTALCDDAITQHTQGWMGPPIPLNADGIHTTWRSNRYNVASPFGVEESEKLRACVDLRHSLTHLACHVATPLRLVSWGHSSKLPQLLNYGADDCGSFKADHEAAYIQLPPKTSTIRTLRS